MNTSRNTASSPRKINYSHALLVTGLVLSLLVIMFRPAGADATLPTKIDVFDAWDSDTPSSVPLDGVGKATRDFDVILKGKTTPTKVSLTGWPIDKVLENGAANLDGVQFVKVRYAGSGSDGAISLISLDPGAERPPMILASGKKPGVGSFPVPAIVPGQPTDKPITEADIIGFNVGGSNPRISLVPGKPGAKILDVTLRSKRTSSGQIKYTPYVHNGTKNAARKIRWYTATEGDGKGPVEKATTDTFTTDNATTGSAQRSVSVVVTETVSGSTGGANATYNSRKKSKGRTIAPTGSTGSAGNNGTGTPAGNQGSGVNQNGVGSSNTLPNFSSQPTNPTGQAPQTTTPAPQPTPSTSTASPDVDTTAITNAAQNVSGTGGLHTVTGVLLSSPTAAPISDSGSANGTALAALPAPVANQLNSIFQPVDSTEDVWAYVLAVLFAFSISGAVREWVNP